MTGSLYFRGPFVGLDLGLGPYRTLSDNMLSETEGFSPPWPPARSLRLGECDPTDFYFSL